MLEEAKRFLQCYQSDHPSDSKFLARTAKEVEKGRKDAHAPGAVLLHGYLLAQSSPLEKVLTCPDRLNDGPCTEGRRL